MCRFLPAPPTVWPALFRALLPLALALLLAPGCATPKRDSGRVLVRAGGLAELEAGHVGQTFLLENDGPGNVRVRDLGRDLPDSFLYSGQAREYRAPLKLLLSVGGGSDATIRYKSRD